MPISNIFKLFAGRSQGAGPTTRYLLEQKLEGPRNGIYLLTTTISGSLLASAGTEGVRIYDLLEGREVAQPADISTIVRHVSALKWITGAEDPWEVLCFGNGRGWLKIWRHNVRMNRFEEILSRQLGNGTEITAIAADRTQRCTFRIGVGFTDCVIQVWNLDENLDFTPLYSVRVGQTLPKMMLFTGRVNESFTPRKLSVFGMNDGKMLKLHEHSGEILSSKEITVQIGDVDIIEDENVFAIDNTFDGFDLHCFGTGSFIRRFSTARVTPPRVPRQVAFGENRSVVVGGGNDGKITVFDWRSGETLDTLQHEPGTRGSQTITTFYLGGYHYIASASTDDQDHSVIYIWKYRPAQSDHRVREFKQALGWRSLLKSCGKLLVTSLSIYTLGIICSTYGMETYPHIKSMSQQIAAANINKLRTMQAVLNLGPYIAPPTSLPTAEIAPSPTPTPVPSPTATATPSPIILDNLSPELLESFLQVVLSKVGEQGTGSSGVPASSIADELDLPTPSSLPTIEKGMESTSAVPVALSINTNPVEITDVE